VLGLAGLALGLGLVTLVIGMQTTALLACAGSRWTAVTFV